MSDDDAKTIIQQLLASPVGEMGRDVFEIALSKIEKCKELEFKVELLSNWIKQLCATINQNGCNVNNIVGLALEAIK